MTYESSKHELKEITPEYILDVFRLRDIARIIVTAILEDQDMDTAKWWSAYFVHEDSANDWPARTQTLSRSAKYYRKGRPAKYYRKGRV